MSAVKLTVSAELLAELKKYLFYDPETGLFTWIKKVKCSRREVGSIAGSDNGSGYIMIGIKAVNYKAHRLAWAFYYGYMPTRLIDHINGKRSDNRIINLREATDAQNSHNILKARTDNKVGLYL